MGAPPKPLALKVISGTAGPGAHSAVEIEPLRQVPDAPDWLKNEHALTEWRRLAPILVANGLLTEGGLMALAHLCGLHGEIVDCYERRLKPSAYAYSTYRALLGDFGLTPAAQSRVKSGGDGRAAGANKFGKFAKKS